MSPAHFLVFIGAGPSLSSELARLTQQFDATSVVAPAVKSSQRGISLASINEAFSNLIYLLRGGAQRDIARLSVWAYEQPETFEQLWSAFGKAAWIETIPASYRNKDKPTRIYIQDRLKTVMAFLHIIAHSVYNERKTSPCPLPLRNFKNSLSKELKDHWYAGRDAASLAQILEKRKQRFRQLRRDGKYRDDRGLLFTGASDGACHGQPHPAGSLDRCFVEGRFRFGAALFPGFHYDVTSETGTLNCILFDSDGNPRDLGPERRQYINIFPNDHLLPKI